MLGGEDQQVQVRLLTDDETIQLQQNVFSLPVSASNVQLESMVQNLLNSEQDFVFRVGDELLQDRVAKYCQSAELSGEHVLDVHYAVKRLFEDSRTDVPCPDWVSDITISDEFIYAGLYDGKLLRVCMDKTEAILEAPIHEKPIKSVCLVTKIDGGEVIVTSSLDQNLSLVKCSRKKMTTMYALKGHTETVTCCHVAPSQQQLASGGWDSLLKIWSASLDEPGEEKKSLPYLRTPLLTLGGHKQAITGCCWRNNMETVTVSRDMSLKIWDIQLMTCSNTLNITSSLECVSWSPHSGLLAAGSSDKYVRLFDPRGTSETIVTKTLIGHSAWVSDVAWSPTSEYEIAASAYSGAVLIWDTRTCKIPVKELAKHKDKALCVEWRNGVLASGGSDNTLKIYGSLS